MHTTPIRHQLRRRGVATPGTEGPRSTVDPHADRLRANIRRLARAHDLSLAELGRLIGHPNGNALYNLLNGWSESLSARTMMRLCDVFNVTLDALTGRRPDDPPPDAQPAPAAGLWHAQKIAAGLDEAQQALQVARDAIGASERALRAAAALLATSPPGE